MTVFTPVYTTYKTVTVQILYYIKVSFAILVTQGDFYDALT